MGEGRGGGTCNMPCTSLVVTGAAIDWSPCSPIVVAATAAAACCGSFSRSPLVQRFTYAVLVVAAAAAAAAHSLVTCARCCS